MLKNFRYCRYLVFKLFFFTFFRQSAVLNTSIWQDKSCLIRSNHAFCQCCLNILKHYSVISYTYRRQCLTEYWVSCTLSRSCENSIGIYLVFGSRCLVVMLQTALCDDDDAADDDEQRMLLFLRQGSKHSAAA